MTKEGHVTTPEAQAGHMRRSAGILARRQEKYDRAFKGKKFRVDREINLSSEQSFLTIFGNRAQRGFVIINIDDPTEQYAVGRLLLEHIASVYGAVNVPPKGKRNRKGKTNKQKAIEREIALRISLADASALVDDPHSLDVINKETGELLGPVLKPDVSIKTVREQGT